MNRAWLGLRGALVALLLVGCANQSVTPAPSIVAIESATPLTLTAAPQTPRPSGEPTGTVVPSQPTVAPTAAVVPSPPAASPTGPGSLVEPFASGFSALTFVTNAGDGSRQLYALEQQGRIRIVSEGESQSAPPFLDLTDRISCCGERGLLGLAFHPDFATNGRFFVDYTNTAGNTIVSEFKRGADGAVDASAERVLLEVDQPFSNHNGGMLAFGPDGYLYIGLGDGGSAGDPHGNGQSLTTYLGKILRIDVDGGDPYAVPSSNPIQPTSTLNANAKPEIWDWGLRNPWRFSFDRESGALFIGDVGQDEWEEIDATPTGKGGLNFGWNVMEGAHCYGAQKCDQEGLTLPVAEYPHSDDCAVIGGYVYRGTRFPSFVGSYVYADLCSGNAWSLDADAALSGTAVQPTGLGRLPFRPAAFGEDEAGEVYVVGSAGGIYRFVPPG